MSAREPPRNRLLSALLTTLRGRVGMGETSLKIWGSQQHPPVAAYVVESLAQQLVKDGLATHETKTIDGSSFYRPVGGAAPVPTPTPTPAPEVRVSKKPVVALPVDAFLAYCAGVAAGPREASAYSWLRVRGIPRAAAEGLLKQLVEERRLERVEKTVAGEVVVRYVVADPSVEPAPLPRSDAPEPPANDDSDPGDPADDEGAEDDPRAAFDEDPEEEACQRCVSLTRERNALGEELGQGLGDALQRTAELAREVTTLRRGHDDLRLRFCSALSLSAQVEWPAILDRVRDLRDERNAQPEPCVECGSLKFEVDRLTREREEALQLYWSMCNDLAATLGESTDIPGTFLVARVRERLTTQARPTVDGGTLASYLTRLTDDQWLVVQRGRAQLAEARDLRAKAAELEEEGTRTLERLLNEKPSQAPAEPPPPPVEAPPIPAPSGETVREEEAPAGPRWTSPPAYGETRTRIEEVLQSQPTITLPELLEVCCVSMSGARAALNKLEHEGKITINRVSPWIITVRRARRAA